MDEFVTTNRSKQEKPIVGPLTLCRKVDICLKKKIKKEGFRLQEVLTNWFYEEAAMLWIHQYSFVFIIKNPNRTL